MKANYWIILTLVISVTVVECYQEAPEIESCSYDDAAAVSCRWLKAANDFNYTLSYFKASGRYRDCIHQCVPAREMVASNGDIYQECRFEASSISEVFTFFFTHNCTTVHRGVSLCHECQYVSRRKKTFHCNEDTFRLIAPPTDFNFQYEEDRSFSLTWSKPQKEKSMMWFILNDNEPYYKLVYKLNNCTSRHAVNESDMGAWKVWYVGEKTRYASDQLLGGCHYSFRVFASMHKQVWSDPSQTIQHFQPPPVVFGNEDKIESLSQISIEINEDKIESLSQLSIEINETSKFDSGIEPSVLVTIVTISCLIFVFIVACVIFLIMCCLHPEKFKISKPVIMVSMDNLKSNFQFEESDDEREKESATMLTSSKLDQCAASQKRSDATKNNFDESSFNLLMMSLSNMAANDRQRTLLLNSFVENNTLSSRDDLDLAEKELTYAGSNTPKGGLGVFDGEGWIERSNPNYYTLEGARDSVCKECLDCDLETGHSFEEGHKRSSEETSSSSSVEIESGGGAAEYVFDVEGQRGEGQSRWVAPESKRKELIEMISLQKDDNLTEYIRETNLNDECLNSLNSFLKCVTAKEQNKNCSEKNIFDSTTSWGLTPSDIQSCRSRQAVEMTS